MFENPESRIRPGEVAHVQGMVPDDLRATIQLLVEQTVPDYGYAIDRLVNSFEEFSRDEAALKRIYEINDILDQALAGPLQVTGTFCFIEEGNDIAEVFPDRNILRKPSNPPMVVFPEKEHHASFANVGNCDVTVGLFRTEKGRDEDQTKEVVHDYFLAGVGLLNLAPGDGLVINSYTSRAFRPTVAFSSSYSDALLVQGIYWMTENPDFISTLPDRAIHVMASPAEADSILFGFIDFAKP